MNIAIYGKGFLGERLSEYLGAPLYAKHITAESDLEDEAIPLPDVIVNTAGKTGRPNVDWCEDHKDETYFANVTLAKMFADHAKKHNIRLVHFSSGCVYEGDNHGKGWGEEDPSNFEGSFYSHTKAEAERMLKDYDNVLIVRPRMPITATPGNRNLINKLLGYNKVIVVPNSVTIVEDLLPSLKGLIGDNISGTFNFVNPEPVTHKEILDLYEQYSGRALRKEYVNPALLSVKAPRSNTILQTTKLTKTGHGMPPARASLKAIVRAYVAHEKNL